MNRPALEPVIKTVEVPCSVTDAFDVFATGMGDWWPLHKRSMSKRLNSELPLELRVDARSGGRIVELALDGREFHWGTFTHFERPGRLVMDFHMGLPADRASQVEVRFTAIGPDRTRVKLVHSNWEAFGELAGKMRAGYNVSWSLTFEEAYRAAIEERAANVDCD